MKPIGSEIMYFLRESLCMTSKGKAEKHKTLPNGSILPSIRGISSEDNMFMNFYILISL